MKKIGLISGSLRKDSYNTKILKEIIDMLPEGYEGHIIEIGDLPLYNEDIDQGNPPESYERFRSEIEEMDGYIMATPEYNRSIPAAIKNALDVGSRPYGHNKWDNKPVGVISSSLSSVGGAIANHALRQVFVFLNLIPLQKPEAYLNNIHECFLENGRLDDRTSSFLKDYVDAFIEHLNKFS